MLEGNGTKNQKFIKIKKIEEDIRPHEFKKIEN